MAWYWWVLIIIGVIGLVIIKTKATSAFFEETKREERTPGTPDGG